MRRPGLRGALLVVGIGLALSSPACGKKAPLRLPEDQTTQRAPVPRARVREGRVILDFRVPAHRVFPEREDPWVLARILRLTAPSPEVVEAGAILKSEGFAFDAPLTWSDQVLPAKGTYTYRVEFRDGMRRRRALSGPLSASWDRLPGAPPTLATAGHLRSIVLDWAAPPGADQGTSYRVYRRELAQATFEPATTDPIAGNSFVDVRTESGRDYCYEVRAVLKDKALEVEGPASPESCSRTAAEELPQPQPPSIAP